MKIFVRKGLLYCFMINITLLCVSFASAGGSRDKETTPRPAGQAVATKADPFGKYTPPVTVTTVRGLNSTQQFDEKDPDKRSLDENRWYKAYYDDLGIKLVNKWVSTDNDSAMVKWNAAIASGDLPDFAQVNNNVYAQLLDADLIADMSGLVRQYASPDYLDIIDESYYKQMTFDGKLLGIPISQKAYTGTRVLFLRKDWLDKLGLPVPVTLEDVVSVARAFQNARLGGENTIGILFDNALFKDDMFLNGYGVYKGYWVEKDGALVYSETLPEMKDALLAMQALYREGIMNKDFTVIKSDQAVEYMASGKAGIFYMAAWFPQNYLPTLLKNDPKAEIISLFPPSVKGKAFAIQTDSQLVPMKIFVNKKSKNPEAVIKIANLVLKYWLDKDKYYQYGKDREGFNWFKYIPWNEGIVPPLETLNISYAIEQAETTGNMSYFRDAGALAYYDIYKLAQKGESAALGYPATYGPNSAYSVIYKAYQEGKILLNKFNGLPTETMQRAGNTINDGLAQAKIAVIMGENPSVYDKAVEAWYASGGRRITEEVNAWYKKQ